ncbi:MAG: dipeptide epimerase [Candidatus Palauibacterales bacterium]|nr:dipeptide epimerase [Candidatus Palauibacterales bacterium]
MKLTWETFTIRAKHPFKISRSVQESVERVWVRVEADGQEGWGEADPSPYYGETSGTVVAALERMTPVIDAAPAPEGLEMLERALAGAIGHNGSARAAVSAALHDLVGKRAGQPLWKLWGLEPSEAPLSSFTIGLDEPEVLKTKVAEAAGYPILKVKLGTDRDEEVISTICDAAAPGTVLRVDANAGWTARDAIERIAMLADYGVEFVEQPLPPADREGYRFLHGRSALPIIVDESCITSSDIPGLVGMADGINIKLSKCGGPREAMRMIHTARACGLRVMMGCMLESSLGIAPAAHLASLLDYADLDGAELIASDPFAGPGLRGAEIHVGDEPGLGVRRA